MKPTIENWTEQPAEIGPLYPFVGTELLMGVACALVCVGFLVWKFRTERTHYADLVRRLNAASETSHSASEQTASADTGTPDAAAP